MVTRGAKEYPETISSEIQGGRPLHFLRVLSWVPLLEYPPTETEMDPSILPRAVSHWARRARMMGVTRVPGVGAGVWVAHGVVAVSQCVWLVVIVQHRD
eukprot:COSAG06_NODE_38707_length_420_cov_1.523364_1_plen_98_part_10